MTTNATQSAMVRAESLDASLYTESDLSGLPSLTVGAALTGLSRAFDLAEGRRPGHAQRVAHIATELARGLGLSRERVADAFFAGLLHDVGVAVVGGDASMSSRHVHAAPGAGDPGLPVYVIHDADRATDPLTMHCNAGARVARALGFSDVVAEAISQHHNSWARARGGTSTSSGGRWVARVVAAADRFEAIIDHDVSPLLVRRRGPELIRQLSGAAIDPRIAAAMERVTQRDGFWLGLYDNELHVHLMSVDPGSEMDGETLMDLLGVVSDMVDARAHRDPEHGRRVADLGGRIAAKCGMPESHAGLVKAAALLQDVGTLGVPVQFMQKPDILSVDEMAAMQLHPSYARDIVSELPGFGAVAWWIGCHHERIDGKGYPGMLEGGEVPVEAQVIGMAEAYVALTSDRPYRPGMQPLEAAEVIHGMGGARFDRALLRPFDDAITEMWRA